MSQHEPTSSSPPTANAWPRVILHVDMDAFFASVEQLDDPSLRGRPVLVGHDGPRGVVAAASYEARPFGCRSAQPMALARSLCPHAAVVPVRFARYHEVSQQVFDLFHEVTPAVQPLSVDEAFLDLTGCERMSGPAVEVARRLRAKIRAGLGLAASVGVAPNKFLAKLASDLRKPDALTVIGPGDVEAVLPPLPVTRIWGVGPVAAERLAAGGVRTIADLRRMPDAFFSRHFGRDGGRVRALCFGIDDRPVTPDRDAKSISQEQTFGTDVADPAAVRQVILGQAEQVARRLRRAKLFARAVVVKIRYGSFHTVTRTTTLEPASDATETIWQAARGCFDGWAAGKFQAVRLIGVGAARLTPDAGQLPLFGTERDEKLRRLDTTLDAISAKFGKNAVRRGVPREE